MSKAFNNAFIRAYAKGQGATPATTTSKPADESRQPLPEEGGRADSKPIHLLDQNHDLPQPHLTFVETSVQVTTELYADPEFLGAPILAGESAGEEASYSLLVIPELQDVEEPGRTEDADEPEVAEPTGAETAAKQAATGEFLSAWEVDRIIWPEICDRLYAAETEYFDQAGSQLLEATQDGLNVLAISSTVTTEGRTTLALSIARAAAQAGVRVALVDANIRNPGLAATLRFEPESSWNEVLDGRVPLEETAIAVLEEGITLFPLRAAGRLNLHDARVSEVINRIASHHDLVIVDTPPIGDGGAAFFQGGDRCPIQAAIVVRDVRRTSHTEALGSVERLRQHGISAVGIAENFGPSA